MQGEETSMVETKQKQDITSDTLKEIENLKGKINKEEKSYEEVLIERAEEESFADVNQALEKKF